MGRAKKDFRSLNIRLERSVHDQLDAYCESSGRTKTIVVERAIMMYLNAHHNTNAGGTAANG